MSTRANLLPPPATTAGGGAGATPPTTTTPRPRFEPPATSDATLSAMRPDPTHTVAQIVVAQDGTGDYDNIGDAIAAVEQARAVPMAVKALTSPTPFVRVDIGIKPGVYDHGTWDGGFATPWINVYALDPTPHATVCNYGIEPWGGLYWEGVDLINPPEVITYDPKYAAHIHSNAGGEKIGSTVIFANMMFANRTTASGGGGMPIGMDGEEDGTLVLHNVTLERNGASGERTGIHGFDNLIRGMDDIVFSRVTFAGGHLFYSALNDHTTEHMWVVDCAAKSAGIEGAATSLHIARSTLDGTYSGPYAGVKPVQSGAPLTGVTDTRSDWPIPTGGLSAHDKQRWGIA